MQMKCGVNPMGTGEEAGQQWARVLGTCHTCNLARLHHNGGNSRQEIRYSSLFARSIHILELLLFQELHPTHLER